jgi:hypothetical protein
MHKRIISSVKRVEFVSSRMLYIIPRGPWCDIKQNKLRDLKTASEPYRLIDRHRSVTFSVNFCG